VESLKKLYRSRRDAKLFGLCGGLAEMMNVDSTLIRLVLVVAAFFSGGTVIPLYIIASIIIPKEPLYYDPAFHRGYFPGGPGPGHGGPGGYSGVHTDSGYHGYGGHGATYAGGPYGTRPAGVAGEGASQLDEMMKDIEKKAMQKEIEELRARLAQLEKANKTSKGDE
jgi:phage shock protein PspC (stress-responsive transcriptional regulator)